MDLQKTINQSADQLTNALLKKSVEDMYKNLEEAALARVNRYQIQYENKVDSFLKEVEAKHNKMCAMAQTKDLEMQKMLDDLLKPQPVATYVYKGVSTTEYVHSTFHQIHKILNSAQRSVKNIMLVGPAGGGKTHLASSVARSMDLEFYPLSVGAQTTKSDLMGFVTATGTYQTSPVREAFEKGGVLLLDEFDAAHAGVVTILNALLSNSEVSFPDKKVNKHERFVVLTACNTFGRGADNKYVGRNKLDAATLDRFITIVVDYDLDLEKQLVQNDSVIRVISKIRRNVEDKGINLVVSPRASMNLADLREKGFGWKEAIEIAVLKGMQIDVARKVLEGVDDICKEEDRKKSATPPKPPTSTKAPQPDSAPKEFGESKKKGQKTTTSSGSSGRGAITVEPGIVEFVGQLGFGIEEEPSGIQIKISDEDRTPTSPTAVEFREVTTIHGTFKYPIE